MENSPTNENPITPLAITNYRDIRQRFGIKRKNRRGHMYLIDKTGTGKSTLIQNRTHNRVRTIFCGDVTQSTAMRSPLDVVAKWPFLEESRGAWAAMGWLVRGRC
jgi:hypothetical protein